MITRGGEKLLQFFFFNRLLSDLCYSLTYLGLINDSNEVWEEKKKNTLELLTTHKCTLWPGVLNILVLGINIRWSIHPWHQNASQYASRVTTDRILVSRSECK